MYLVITFVLIQIVNAIFGRLLKRHINKRGQRE
jgi:hypothetical protein